MIMDIVMGVLKVGVLYMRHSGGGGSNKKREEDAIVANAAAINEYNDVVSEAKASKNNAKPIHNFDVKQLFETTLNVIESEDNKKLKPDDLARKEVLAEFGARLEEDFKINGVNKEKALLFVMLATSYNSSNEALQISVLDAIHNDRKKIFSSADVNQFSFFSKDATKYKTINQLLGNEATHPNFSATLNSMRGELNQKLNEQDVVVKAEALMKFSNFAAPQQKINPTPPPKPINQQKVPTPQIIPQAAPITNAQRQPIKPKEIVKPLEPNEIYVKPKPNKFERLGAFDSDSNLNKMLASLNKVGANDKVAKKWQAQDDAARQCIIITNENKTSSFSILKDKIVANDTNVETYRAMLMSFQSTYSNQIPVITAPEGQLQIWKDLCLEMGIKAEFPEPKPVVAQNTEPDMENKYNDDYVNSGPTFK